MKKMTLLEIENDLCEFLEKYLVGMPISTEEERDIVASKILRLLELWDEKFDADRD